VVEWAEKASGAGFRFINLTGVQAWEDEAGRIQDKTLDYNKVITRELAQLEKVRSDFQAMGEGTY